MYVPFDIRINSWNFLSQVLKPEASPLRDSGLKMEMKWPKEERFNDLLRYTWTFDNREIRITESLNAIRIQVTRRADQDPEKELGSIIRFMIQVKRISAEGKPYKLRIPRLKGLVSGDFFSSNPEVELPHMLSWSERFDGMVREGGFEIDFYKKLPQLMGFQNGHGWIRLKCGLQTSHQSGSDGSKFRMMTTGIYAVPMGPSACPERYSPTPIKTTQKTLDSLKQLLEKSPNNILVALDLADSKDRVYLPLLARAFAKSKEDREKQYYAHALVLLGAKDTVYANFMRRRVREVLEMDIPDTHTIGVNKSSAGYSKEFREWCRRQKMDTMQAAMLPDEHSMAFQLLVYKPDPGNADILLQGLHARNFPIVRLSAEKLAKLGDSRFADSIIKSMESRPLRERKAMARSLDCFDSPEAGRIAGKYAQPKNLPEALRKTRD